MKSRANQVLEDDLLRPARAGTNVRRSPDSPANFDRLARPYRWLEYASFGPYLAWARFAFLHRLSHRRRALVLGDGDGRFTARLLRDNPRVIVDAVDASPAMLRALLERAGKNASRITAHVVDARQIRSPRADLGSDSLAAQEDTYDLVVSHFFLDCLMTDEVNALVTAVRPSLAKGAIWVVSEFAVPDNWFGRLIARPFIAALYRGFAVLTRLRVNRLPDHPEALKAAGMTLSARQTFLFGLLVSELWEAN